MRARRARAVLLASLAASFEPGCVFGKSPMARTYVLDPLPAAPAPAPAPVAVVGVLKVTVPGWIDRPQITGRAATGEIVSDEYARWGEPIGRGIQRVLAENLAGLLPDRRIVTAPFAAGIVVDQRLDVTVSEAARQADGSVLVEARWSVLGLHGEPLIYRRSSRRSQPTALGASGAVAGVNEALAGLNREIADALRELPARSEPATGGGAAR